MDDTLKGKIKNIVGSKDYFDSQEDKLSYSFDGTPIFQHLPEAVVFPSLEHT